jgi:2-phospho-L-lactate guanylyltransferase
MPSPDQPHASLWQVLLPVRAKVGKSRLGGTEDPTEFFARDTIAAARASIAVASITIVGRDLPDADRVIGDPEEGLNSAITAGLQSLNPNQPVVVILADLPSLRSTDLDAILLHCGQRSIVIDHTGSGTTMALSDTPDFSPHFGLDSAAKFLADGFTALETEPTARLDVDTVEDLNHALRLGVGPATAAWWKRNHSPSYTYCRLK